MPEKFTVRPCIKGAIMVVIGILITRMGWGAVPPIGIGRLTSNLIFGPIAYFFLALAGLFIIKMVDLLEDPSQGVPSPQFNTKVVRDFLLFGAFYITGVVITAYNVIIYNLDIYIIYFIAIIGILWLSLGLYATQQHKAQFNTNLIISLTFTLGIFYGAISNNIAVPLYIYIIFLAAFFLQFSRELVKRFNEIEDEEASTENSETPTQLSNIRNILFTSLVFQLGAIAFLSILPFTGIYNPILYLYPMIPGAVLIGLAAFFTKKSISAERKIKRIRIIIRIAILLVLIAFILAS
ncbi:MAG: hypothetical protein ACTSQI_04265 [Candidatus Helarchaeota archaeon]